MLARIFLTLMILFPLAAHAQNTAPGSNGQLLQNINGKYGAVTTSTNQAALNNINITNLGTASYQDSNCGGGGDEGSIFTAITNARSANHGSVLIRDGCSLSNQMQLTSGTGVSLFNFGASWSEYNTVKGCCGASQAGASMNYYVPGVFANAAGQTAIDMHGVSILSLQGLNFFSQVVTAIDQFSGNAQIGNSQTAPGCCNTGTLLINQSALGGGVNTVIGTPVDSNLNAIAAGGVKTGHITNAGSGYVDGTYTRVPLTGGAGSGAYAASIIVSGGVVTTVNLYALFVLPLPGSGYAIGNVLSASNANLGGSGSNFQFTTDTVYSAGFKNATIFPYITDSFISGVNGCALCTNFTDARLIGTTFTAGQAIQTFFGGGGDLFGFLRLEDTNRSIDIGGPNGNGFIGSNTLIGLNFTRPGGGAGFGAGFSLRIGRGGNDVVLGHEYDIAHNSAFPDGSIDTTAVIIGGNGSYSGGIWDSSSFDLTATDNPFLYCYDIPAGFTTNYVKIGGRCTGTGSLLGNIRFGQVPVQYVEDFVGPFGRHTDMGRPFAIGTSIPLGTSQAALEVRGTTSIVIPSGTTGQRPTAVAGMVRYNSTTGQYEGYGGLSPAWGPLGGIDASYLPNFIGGLTLSNDVSTPNTVIDIVAGAATDDTSAFVMKIAAFTKTTGTFTAGTGNGCLDTGSVANSTWYHTFLIQRTDLTATDVLCSTSATSPTMPANYTYKRRIGSIKTNGSAQILAFKQVGSVFYWSTPTLDINTNALSTTAALQTLNVPPGVKVMPLCRMSMQNDGNSVILTSGDETDIAPTNANPITAAPGSDLIDLTVAAGVLNATCPLLTTNTAQQIRARASASSTTLSIVTRGWVD